MIFLDVPLEMALARLSSAKFSRSRPPITEPVLLELAQRFEYPGSDENAAVIPAGADAAQWVAENLRRRMG